MTHAKALAITVAYDVYKEVCEGKLDPAYKIDHPVTFFQFREKLAKQMLHYSPKHRKYHGDDKFCCATRQLIGVRSPSPRRSLVLNPSSSDDTSTIASVATRDQVEAASDRLCGDLGCFEKHEAAMTQFKNYRSCVICGRAAYWKCSKCPGQPVLHRHPPKDNADNIPCHVKYHNTIRFGITRAESTKRKWNEPTPEVSKKHAQVIKKVCESIVIANANVLPSSS